MSLTSPAETDTGVIPYKYSTDSKKIQVEKMFDSIAPRYDFLNRFLSLKIDVIWRKNALRLLQNEKINELLDVATGTGDFAILAHTILNPKKITAVDLSAGMLAVGNEKIKARGLDHVIEMQKQDSENLSFADGTFDAVTVAFGVRNFENLEKGLKELYRVLKPGGKILILEFSTPQRFPVKQLFGFYFRYILPTWGRIISRSKEAYEYLPESVGKFPYGTNFTDILSSCGFINPSFKPYSSGICTAYIASK